MQDPAAALVSLDALHRDALVVLALDAERPRSRTHWQERCAEAGLEDDRGRNVHGEAFRRIADALVSTGAVLRDARNEHAVAAGWLAPLLEEAHRRGRLGPIAVRLAASRRHSFSGGLGVRGQLLAALVQGDAAAVARAETGLRFRMAHYRECAHELVDVLGLDAPHAWIARLPPALQLDYLRSAAVVAFVDARRLGGAVRAAAVVSGDEAICAQVAAIDALAADAAGARDVLHAGGTAQWTRGVRAFLALTEGRHAEARELFAAAAVGSRGQRVELPSWLAIFDVLLAVTSDRADEVADVARRIHKGKRAFTTHPGALYALMDLDAFRRTAAKRANRFRPTGWLDALVIGLANLWTGVEGDRAALAAYAARARAGGCAWLAGELDAIATGSDGGTLRGSSAPLRSSACA